LNELQCCVFSILALGKTKTENIVFLVQVKQRTSNFEAYAMGSHVMQYGDANMTAEKLYLYHGFDPATVNFPPHNGRLKSKMEVVNQRDAELLFMWQMVCLFSPQIKSSHLLHPL